MTAKVFIFGFVQDVGFRHFVKSKANELSLKGWVRNLPDGSVEALLQGSKENIDKMVKLCKTGPFLTNVEKVKVQWETVPRSGIPAGGKKFSDFRIV